MNNITPVTTEFERVSDGCFRIKGQLSFNSVFDLWQENKEELFAQKNDNIDIDFSQLSRSDSSGIALLIEWYREAIKKGKIITFSNLPEQMLHMVEICGLDEFLPLSR